MQNVPNNVKNISLDKYSDLINTVAKVEYSRLISAKHLLEYSELVNIASVAVYVVLSSQPEQMHNSAYISTAIKWAIRNELRRRFKWYSKRNMPKNADDCSELTVEDLRETVYETILSIDELEGSDSHLQIEDTDYSPEERIELRELKVSVAKALSFLPPRERTVLEAKFFKNKKIKEIAKEMGVSPSRISKLVQASLDKIKELLIEQGVL